MGEVWSLPRLSKEQIVALWDCPCSTGLHQSDKSHHTTAVRRRSVGGDENTEGAKVGIRDALEHCFFLLLGDEGQV